MELSEMLLGELTVEQYIVLIATFCGVLFGLIFIAVCLFGLIKEIFAFIEYFFRKDKYKQYDFAAIRAYRHIASLRKQVKNAPNEKSHFLFYNQLLGAVHFAREMGYIGERNVLRLLDIPRNYEKSESEEK